MKGVIEFNTIQISRCIRKIVPGKTRCRFKIKRREKWCLIRRTNCRNAIQDGILRYIVFSSKMGTCQVQTAKRSRFNGPGVAPEIAKILSDGLERANPQDKPNLRPSQEFRANARGGTRTLTPRGHRILNPARLPIPPLSPRDGVIKLKFTRASTPQPENGAPGGGCPTPDHTVGQASLWHNRHGKIRNITRYTEHNKRRSTTQTGSIRTCCRAMRIRANGTSREGFGKPPANLRRWHIRLGVLLAGTDVPASGAHHGPLRWTTWRRLRLKHGPSRPARGSTQNGAVIHSKCSMPQIVATL